MDQTILGGYAVAWRRPAFSSQATAYLLAAFPFSIAALAHCSSCAAPESELLVQEVMIYIATFENFIIYYRTYTLYNITTPEIINRAPAT